MLINANRIMLWGLYLGFFSGFIGIITFILATAFKQHRIKNRLIRTSIVMAIIVASIDIIFYFHNWHNEAIMYTKGHSWYNVPTLILNAGKLQNGDVLIKSRGKGLENSAGHSFIYYKGKFISFNRQGDYNTEIMTFEQMLDYYEERKNDKKHPFVDKYVILRPKKPVNIENELGFIKDSGKLKYTPTPLQLDTKKYNCSTFVYRILEHNNAVPVRKFISIMPYDFLHMNEFNEVKLDKTLPNDFDGDFLELFDIIDLFNEYDVPINLEYKNGKIVLSSDSIDFVKYLMSNNLVDDNKKVIISNLINQ